MPLLDAPDDVHAQLPVLLQRVLPVHGDGVGQRQEARHGADHHFSHLIVLARVGVDVLDASERWVRFVRVVESAQRFHDLFREPGDLQLLREEV